MEGELYSVRSISAPSINASSFIEGGLILGGVMTPQRVPEKFLRMQNMLLPRYLLPFIIAHPPPPTLCRYRGSTVVLDLAICIWIYGCGANADTQVKYFAPDFANEAKRRGQPAEVQWPASPWGGPLRDRGNYPVPGKFSGHSFKPIMPSQHQPAFRWLSHLDIHIKTDTKIEKKQKKHGDVSRA